MSLFRAEYRKISRRKVFPVMAAVLIVFVGLAAFFLFIFGEIAPEIADELPVLEKPEVYTVGAQQAVTQTWFPLILATVLLGGDLSTTVWASALTRDSRRINQILSRFVTYSLATTVAFLFAFFLWVGLAYFFAPGDGFMETSEFLSIFWKAGLVAMAWTSLGTGAVAMLRSVGPAIGVGIAIYFAEQFLALWDVWENISLTAATTALFFVDIGGGFGSFIPGGDLPLWHQLSIIVAWTFLGLGFTWWGLQRRDA